MMLFIARFFAFFKTLTLPAFICIGLALLLLCAMFYPDRLPQLLAFINRQFFAALFVFILFAITEMDNKEKPLVLGLALVGAGMAV